MQASCMSFEHKVPRSIQTCVLRAGLQLPWWVVDEGAHVVAKVHEVAELSKSQSCGKRLTEIWCDHVWNICRYIKWRGGPPLSIHVPLKMRDISSRDLSIAVHRRHLLQSDSVCRWPLAFTIRAIYPTTQDGHCEISSSWQRTNGIRFILFQKDYLLVDIKLDIFAPMALTRITHLKFNF